MDTHYAPAPRLNGAQLQAEIELVTKNPIADGLLHSVSGLLAILNNERQILAVNEVLLEMLGAGTAYDLCGLRIGEVFNCVHASEMPAGCGTSTYCSTCGAAVSMVISQTTNSSVEKDCALTSIDDLGKKRDLFFRVQCKPITYDTKPFLLLFLQDTTLQQRLATLERVFFHDINGALHGLLGISDMITSADADELPLLTSHINTLSMRLASEISIQQCLSKNDIKGYQPSISTITSTSILQEIESIFVNHPLRHGKKIIFTNTTPEIQHSTDTSLLIKVLRNMVINALEETAEGSEIKIWSTASPSTITYSVWNAKPIPAPIAKRIFQRNFSTKGSTGRGLGTYSMKLFGEEILGAAVDFTTSEQEGTVFRIVLKR